MKVDTDIEYIRAVSQVRFRASRSRGLRMKPKTVYYVVTNQRLYVMGFLDVMKKVQYEYLIQGLYCDEKQTLALFLWSQGLRMSVPALIPTWTNWRTLTQFNPSRR